MWRIHAVVPCSKLIATCSSGGVDFKKGGKKKFFGSLSVFPCGWFSVELGVCVRTGPKAVFNDTIDGAVFYTFFFFVPNSSIVLPSNCNPSVNCVHLTKKKTFLNIAND